MHSMQVGFGEGTIHIDILHFITSWKIRILNPKKWRFGSDGFPFQLSNF